MAQESIVNNLIEVDEPDTPLISLIEIPIDEKLIVPSPITSTDFASTSLTENNPFDTLQNQAEYFDDPFEILSNNQRVQQNQNCCETNIPIGELIGVDEEQQKGDVPSLLELYPNTSNQEETKLAPAKPACHTQNLNKSSHLNTTISNPILSPTTNKLKDIISDNNSVDIKTLTNQLHRNHNENLFKLSIINSTNESMKKLLSDKNLPCIGNESIIDDSLNDTAMCDRSIHTNNVKGIPHNLNFPSITDVNEDLSATTPVWIEDDASDCEIDLVSNDSKIFDKNVSLILSNENEIVNKIVQEDYIGREKIIEKYLKIKENLTECKNQDDNNLCKTNDGKLETIITANSVSDKQAVHELLGAVKNLVLHYPDEAQKTTAHKLLNDLTNIITTNNTQSIAPVNDQLIDSSKQPITNENNKQDLIDNSSVNIQENIDDNSIKTPPSQQNNNSSSILRRSMSLDKLNKSKSAIPSPMSQHKSRLSVFVTSTTPISNQLNKSFCVSTLKQTKNPITKVRTPSAPRRPTGSSKTVSPSPISSTTKSPPLKINFKKPLHIQPRKTFNPDISTTVTNRLHLPTKNLRLRVTAEQKTKSSGPFRAAYIPPTNKFSYQSKPSSTIVKPQTIVSPITKDTQSSSVPSSNDTSICLTPSVPRVKSLTTSLNVHKRDHSVDSLLPNNDKRHLAYLSQTPNPKSALSVSNPLGRRRSFSEYKPLPIKNNSTNVPTHIKHLQLPDTPKRKSLLPNSTLNQRLNGSVTNKENSPN